MRSVACVGLDEEERQPIVESLNWLLEHGDGGVADEDLYNFLDGLSFPRPLDFWDPLQVMLAGFVDAGSPACFFRAEMLVSGVMGFSEWLFPDGDFDEVVDKIDPEGVFG